ncbi:MAG: DNA-processing protein DprA [Tannerellaceae bacterium]|jgi:DNA processing protein|nr:DNA-processing protein DprA [Tannerellaceae bacterium]
MTKPNLYQVALTMINGIGNITGRQLLESLGSAEAVFATKRQDLEQIPGIGQLLAKEIKQPGVLKKAEEELVFIEKNKIKCFFFTDNDYPKRLQQCPDAPLLLYCKGNIHLQAKHVINIVGTRKASAYGKEQTEKLITHLANALPDILIVSGLAYGIDIIAHRSALKNQLSTVAVLAHGLDRIYPQAHRQTAIEMLENGGLLTDFPSNTNPDKPNFVKRNRIIAGLADATLVVESANKGGSLITADIAFSYDRDVFAFPGRATDSLSEGCNRIIRQNKAGLITCANDLIEAMSWDLPGKKALPPVQTELFTHENENDDVNRICAILKEKGQLHINELTRELDMPVFKLSSLLVVMEMDGIIKAIPGSRYAFA